MMLSIDDWRKAWIKYDMPLDAIPEHPDLGLRYPWKEIAIRSMSSVHKYKVDVAKQRLIEALNADIDWRLGWSAGKDSTALAVLGWVCGLSLPSFGEKDDIDYPGEEVYLQRMGKALGHGDVEILRPKVSLLAWLAEHKIDLTADLHGQAASLSSEHFYGLLREHRKQKGYNGVILGLRSDESKHRAVNRASHGWMYKRKGDDLTVACPIADWEDIDVHAFLASHNIPLLPVYFCVDPGMIALKLRKSWWIAGGGCARHGHYTWLRRWWPDLYEKAATIDSGVRLLS